MQQLQELLQQPEGNTPPLSSQDAEVRNSKSLKVEERRTKEITDKKNTVDLKTGTREKVGQKSKRMNKPSMLPVEEGISFSPQKMKVTQASRSSIRS